MKLSILNNQMMVLNLDSSSDRTLFFYNIVEKDLSNFLLRNLEPDDVFFDIGASGGYFSLLAASIIRNGEIHAFEPVRSSYKNILKSVKLNNIKNIKINNYCVGRKNGMGDFFISSKVSTSSFKKTEFQKDAQKTRCKITTLGNYCQKNKIKKIDIIKLDVEGGEKDILFSSKKLLEKFHPILAIEFDSKLTKEFGYNPNEIYDFLTSLGYKMYSYNMKKLRIQNKKDVYEGEEIYCLYKNAVVKPHPN